MYKNATYVSVLYANNDNAPDTGFDSQQLISSFFFLHCLKHQMSFKNLSLNLIRQLQIQILDEQVQHGNCQ